VVAVELVVERKNLNQPVANKVAEVLLKCFVFRFCDDDLDLACVAVLENVLFHWSLAGGGCGAFPRLIQYKT
jgi:hypothetical protein